MGREASGQCYQPLTHLFENLRYKLIKNTKNQNSDDNFLLNIIFFKITNF